MKFYSSAEIHDDVMIWSGSIYIARIQSQHFLARIKTHDPSKWLCPLEAGQQLALYLKKLLMKSVYLCISYHFRSFKRTVNANSQHLSSHICWLPTKLSRIRDHQLYQLSLKSASLPSNYQPISRESSTCVVKSKY